MAELRISEVELKKMQDNLTHVKEQLDIKEGKLNKSNQNNDQLTTNKRVSQDDIKEFKKKLKGNISLIEARQIVWDDIIQEVYSIWDYIHIISQQNIIMNGSKLRIDACKKNVQKEAMEAKNMIKYLNGKYSTELRALDITDKDGAIMEINKMNEKNALHIQDENRLK